MYLYTRDDDVKEFPHIYADGGHYYNNTIPMYIILYYSYIIWEMCTTGKGATAKDR